MENFDRENIEKFVKFINIFPRQNFAPYGIYPGTFFTEATNFRIDPYY